MMRKRLIGFGGIVLLIIAVWIGIGLLPSDKVEEEMVLPPKLSPISAEYVTSTDEVIIRWDIENVDIHPLNTGVRYDVISHGTTTATSETYPQFLFSTKIDNGFEARIDVSELEKFYYRIQVADNNEFLWSDEAQVLIVKDE
jgi:hypothetical protein